MTKSYPLLTNAGIWLRGVQCWYVNAGGAAASSFSLSFGNRILRGSPLKNPTATNEFRAFEGEFSLYVWCSWRLETADQAVASSDQDNELSTIELEKLAGLTVTALDIDQRTTDLVLTFGDLVLRVFSDHLPVSPSYPANWEFYARGSVLRAGPGFAWSEEQL
jgi:hypothetical protein